MQVRSFAPVVAVALFLLSSLSIGQRQDSQNPYPEQRIPVLVVTGESEHDWRWTSTWIHGFLMRSGKFHVEVEIYPEAVLSFPSQLARFRCIILDYDGLRWGEEAEANFLKAVQEGTGVVALHGASGAFPDWEEYGKLLGWVDGPAAGHEDHRAFDVQAVDREHPVMTDFRLREGYPDQLHYGLRPVEGTEHRVLATARSELGWNGSGKDEPVVVAGSYGEGRVIQTTLGHVGYGDPRSWQSCYDEGFQRFLVRAVEWAATGKVAPLKGLAPNTMTPADRAAGWKLLFDGESFSGWRGLGQAAFPEERWRVESGELRVLPGEGSGDILVEETFDEFELELEWRIAAQGADAGLFYRIGEDGRFLWRTDLDLKQDTEDEEALEIPRDLVPAEGSILRPTGEFNHARVVATRTRVEQWLNGIRLLELDMGSAEWAQMIQDGGETHRDVYEQLPLGHIALQDRGHDVWFRNIKIRRIEPPPPTQEPASRPIELLNGRDLSGWSAHWWTETPMTEDVWSYDGEGNLVCKGSPVGYLRTEEQFRNYVLEVEWRYDPRTRQQGEAGIMVCMSGADEIWPRCLEVQIDYTEIGDVWTWQGFPIREDPDRTNGQITRRFQDAENPAGDWNRYVITAVGDRLTVELNGIVVNELEGVEDAAGWIGLRSEEVAVHYRNMRLTPAR